MPLFREYDILWSFQPRNEGRGIVISRRCYVPPRVYREREVRSKLRQRRLSVQ